VTPLYLSNGVAAVLYWIAIIVWIVSEAVIAARTIPRSRGNLRQDHLSGLALIGGVVLSVALGARLAVLFPDSSIVVARPEIFVLGILLAVAGVALRQYVVGTLGRFFTTRVMTQPGQTVVEAVHIVSSATRATAGCCLRFWGCFCARPAGPRWRAF
jgi:protein-S-isoprenylcysteine O-methyltransferase Ste14